MQSGERRRRKTVSADAVRRAENVLQAHADLAIPVATLSRLVGLSDRGLRNAFHRVHGVSPKRWMVAARLERVRRALAAARTGRVSVTDVATEHGFYDLGRFAAAYRQTFGEHPSQTLRAARQRSEG
jgi:AraC family ethanolamine operon transcriptional activator